MDDLVTDYILYRGNGVVLSFLWLVLLCKDIQEIN